jgi:outer membrane protein OmpA-like peptidoglycan-associated protein
VRHSWIILGMCILPSCTMLGLGPKPDYIVFFQQGSVTVDPTAAAIIARAAAKARTMPDATVTVYGYTDSAASPQADVLLSQQRAQHVADALVADGVAPGRILRHGRGQTGNNPGVASRRVEINVSG